MTNLRTAVDWFLLVLATLLVSGLSANLRALAARANRARRDSEIGLEALSRLAAIVEASGEPIIGKSLDGIVTSWNSAAERLYGYTAAEMIGTPLSRLVPPDRPDEIPAILRRIRAGERIERFQTVRQRKDQTLVDVSVTVSPVTDADGRVVGAAAIHRDVTRERELDQLKNQLVSLASHELRTPLTSIKGYADLLADGEAGPLTEEQRSFLSVITRNADRLSSLVNDVLDLSRIESGRAELHLQPVDVNHLVRDTAEALRPQLDSKCQSLTLDLHPNLPPLSADADRLVQVLTNLLSNAHKYTPPDGAVFVTTSLDGAAIRIDVRDTGIGMSQTDVAQLFTQFFRARSSAALGAGGTGLGLAISQQLVRLHGGRIAVRSSPGQGSTFFVFLPLTPSTPTTSAPSPPASG